jgi:hypothetical protein
MPSVMIADDDLILADMLEEAPATIDRDVCDIARTVEKAAELDEGHKPDLAALNIWLADGGLGTGDPARLKSLGLMVRRFCTDGVIQAFRIIDADR